MLGGDCEMDNCERVGDMKCAANQLLVKPGKAPIYRVGIGRSRYTKSAVF